MADYLSVAQPFPLPFPLVCWPFGDGGRRWHRVVGAPDCDQRIAWTRCGLVFAWEPFNRWMDAEHPEPPRRVRCRDCAA